MKHFRSLTHQLTVVPVMCCCMACGNASGRDNSSDSTVALESYHANNDIAMTLRSLVDAASMGERLDSAAYNYTGVLTDGGGRPLYTDITGAPGEWSVEVMSPSSAIITNKYPGDLLCDDLREYILAHLNVADSTAIVVPASADNPDLEIRRYPMQGVLLTFEKIPATTLSHHEGDLMTIRVESEQTHNQYIR